MQQVLIVLAMFLLTAFSSGCSKPNTAADYKSEAKAVCEVFNPDNWKDLPADLEPYQIQELVTAKLSASLKSDKMKQVIENVPKVEAGKRYHSVVEGVSALTGEPFLCPAMESYLDASFTPVDGKK